MTPSLVTRSLLAAGHPLKVLLLDDHALFRAGVRGLIEREWPGVEVREAGELDEALNLCSQWNAQLAFVDISLKEGDGTQFVQRVRSVTPELVPPPACVVLSMHTGVGYVRRSLDAGALGFVVKDAGPGELLDAGVAAMRGRKYLSPAVGTGLIDGGSSDMPESVLTRRQLEVLRMVAAGHSTKAIARKLGLSVRTVDAHRREISQRLQLHDVVSWVHYAVRHGLTLEVEHE